MQYSDAAPGVKHEQVGVAADKDARARGEGKLQTLVVLGVAAVGYTLGRSKSNCSFPQSVEDARPARKRHGPREARPAKHFDDLRLHLG